jgi:hypothetical protein
MVVLVIVWFGMVGLFLICFDMVDMVWHGWFGFIWFGMVGLV